MVKIPSASQHTGGSIIQEQSESSYFHSFPQILICFNFKNYNFAQIHPRQ